MMDFSLRKVPAFGQWRHSLLAHWISLMALFWMQKTVEGKNYYTFEYELTSPNYSSVSFATIVIANGKYRITWIVTMCRQKWRKTRKKWEKDIDESAFQNLDCSMVVSLYREILHSDSWRKWKTVEKISQSAKSGSRLFQGAWHLKC
jgi:hypothetical protein